MLTIRLNADFIIQLHKTHVQQPLTGAEQVVFTQTLTGREVVIDHYGFKALANCYLLTINTQVLTGFDLDARLNIMAVSGDNNSLVYTSSVRLV